MNSNTLTPTEKRILLSHLADAAKAINSALDFLHVDCTPLAPITFDGCSVCEQAMDEAKGTLLFVQDVITRTAIVQPGEACHG